MEPELTDAATKAGVSRRVGSTLAYTMFPEEEKRDPSVAGAARYCLKCCCSLNGPPPLLGDNARAERGNLLEPLGPV